MTKEKAAALILVGSGYLFLFWDVLVKLVRDWRADENYSHGFLVVPLAGYIVWRNREELARIPIRPWKIGFALIFVSLLTLAAGLIGAELFLTRVALLGVLAGTVLFVLGPAHLKAMQFPLLLLALAIPIPAIIFNQITFPLQLLASRFGELAISTCRIPVLREGNVITLATTTLEVAEACSGIRSLVSLVTLALVWGYLTDSPTWLRWLLAICSVPIAIFANGIRVAGTGIAAHFIGPEAAQGFLHTFSGWMVFIVAGALMLAVDRLARWLGSRVSGRLASSDAHLAGRIEATSAQMGQSRAPVTRSLLVFGCLVATALSLGALTSTEEVVLSQSLSSLPLRVGPWEGRDAAPLAPDILATLRVDEYVNRGYRAPGRPHLSLYVGYYHSQRQGQTMHSPLNCMPGSGWQPMLRTRIGITAPAAIGAASGRVDVNRMIIQKGLDRQLVLYWYQSHGRIVASEYWQKIYTVVDAMRHNRSDGSLVRVIVPVASEGAAAEQAAERTALEFVDLVLPLLSERLGR